jgi:hypothetical protein
VLYDIAKIFDDDKCLDMLQLLVKLKVNLAKPNNWELIFQLALEGKNKCVVEMIERNGFPCTTLNDGNTAAINRLFAGSCDVNYQNEV